MIEMVVYIANCHRTLCSYHTQRGSTEPLGKELFPSCSYDPLASCVIAR
ncbi:hypothetical protein PORCRE_869 [Porphyromonas crevioricanis JCM 15906]|uniref:Uncharacterized protein n=1 Tax=Porphyromonas crevioricanis JCM 15906 TaxID=1305617 RepID=T1DS92_9PORP|nr:hypothetical protein PORCRE_869 [Porphyromonas crevioricanis JCM 15906]GAD07143.1 hypothetical protein PORCAN_760 [Porphyromonas crevioricanis JCM 13913]